MDAFHLYGSLSGQDVNWEKSFIYFSKGVPYGVASSQLVYPVGVVMGLL